MWRCKLTLEYHGGGFHGWQKQDGCVTVQGVLETALQAVLGADVPVTVAGRTDAGVHALAQVAHLDCPPHLSPYRLQQALNFHVKPHRLSILSAEKVDTTFHARFSALRRHYAYHLINRRAPLTVEKGLAWQVAPALDAEAMHAAAQHLVGYHDFTSFRARECQADSPWRTLDSLNVTRHGDRITITTQARSFLHHQVRNIVGTLVLVGRGKWAPLQVKEALAARDRRAAGATAPADGLYLIAVDYGPPTSLESRHDAHKDS